ncbi:unnamed protein product [Sphagnum jensenii]|uniref:Membrane-associated kinase regulator 1 n=1 Tax=Sphagnum jensenii TaxID=128206 RepID=A0ABP1BZE8_9BRYO
MGEPDWSFRDLTGIKPRKPEGDAAAAEYVDDDWEQTPLSFLWPLVGNTSVVCSKHSSQRGERQFDVDKELLLQRPPAKVNMCTAATTTDHRRQTCDEDEDNDDGFQEFEFSMSAAASSSTEREAPSSGMSSADELFFKGQLLPLHLPPRLRMVQRLESSSEKKPQQLESVNTSQIVPVLQAPQATRVLRPSFHPKFTKLWMQNADLLSADGTAVVTDTAGIARFRGHGWSDPPRDRDSSSTDSCRDSTSARDSSSSRDSSGSSQDANFSDSSGSCNKAFQMPPISSDLKGSFLHNREVFGTHVRSFEQQQQRSSSSSSSSSSTISSWLKPPFKWKVLFGAAKKVTATTRSSPSRDLKGCQQRQHQQSLSHVSEEEEGEEEEESSCSDPIEETKCSEETNFCQEDNSGGELSLQTGSSSYSSYMETTTSSSSSSRGLVSSGDIERGDHQRGMAKAREYLHKYMKMLKPLHLKKYEQQELDDVSSCRFTGSFSLPSSSLAHETRRHSRNHIAPGNRSFSSSYSSQSSRFASVTADVVGSPRSRSAVGTPTRRGSGRPLSSGSIAELHSAIQGAIAHCKESQTTAKYESLARRSQRFGSSSSAAAAVR